jgi:hypothetical protein
MSSSCFLTKALKALAHFCSEILRPFLEQQLVSLLLVCIISKKFTLAVVLLKILSNENWGKNIEEYYDILEQKYAFRRPTLACLSCTPASPQTNTSCLFYLRLRPERANVSRRKMANMPMIGWLEVADDVLTFRFFCQYILVEYR